MFGLAASYGIECKCVWCLMEGDDELEAIIKSGGSFYRRKKSRDGLEGDSVVYL